MCQDQESFGFTIDFVMDFSVELTEGSRPRSGRVSLQMATQNSNSAQADFETSKSFAFTTTLEAIGTWGQRNSLWPLPYGTACCGIELMSVMGPKYDLARFGAEVVRFSPRQSDLLLVAGTITEKMAPILIRIYQQMLEPKFVLSMGACSSSGGFYRAYHVVQGIDRLIPVDVYVPGCPPTPEAVLDGVMTLQKMIKDQAPRPWKDGWQPPQIYRQNSEGDVA